MLKWAFERSFPSAKDDLSLEREPIFHTSIMEDKGAE